MTMEYTDVRDMLEENRRRHEILDAPFDPITGEGSIGKRALLTLPDHEIRHQWIPAEMEREPLVADLRRAGSLRNLALTKIRGDAAVESEKSIIAERLIRLRALYDFPFWCARFVYIKRKGGGDDMPFILNRPQRMLAERFERQRIAGKPVRIILLKARQWGGSTCSQLYMAWLQMMHTTGLNSLIIAHQGVASDEIKDMFDRMIAAYPEKMLYEPGEMPAGKIRKLERVGNSRGIYRVPQRNCKIKIGTAERPDSCRGGDYNLVHCSEVGIWRVTDGKTPEMILRSAPSGVLLKPLTMIVYESTANGTGNFFHREYEAAKRGESQFESVFIRWHDIELYSLPLTDPEGFAKSLLAGRELTATPSGRAVPGAYLWRLWLDGATLEAINWYVQERRKYGDQALMAAEYPSNDIEAFTHSGTRVFDRMQVELLRRGCRPPLCQGEVAGETDRGKGAVRNTRFFAEANGALKVWQLPDDSKKWFRRYLVTVDIGGRTAKADWSVIAVMDRAPMANGNPPEIVAQWRGHVDMDVLAWKAAAIAAFYHKALLVFESNSLETRDRSHETEGDQTPFIFVELRNMYDNLYARTAVDCGLGETRPRRYGFHTNTVTKPMVISMLVKAIREGLYVERDEDCIDEFLAYEKRQNGSFGAIPGCHDDILMTRAIGLHICFNEMKLPAPDDGRSRWPRPHIPFSEAMF